MLLLGSSLLAQERRLPLNPAMIRSSAEWADFSGLADEQELIGDPPNGEPKHGWRIPSQHWKQFPVTATIDLGAPRHLSALWIYDTNGTGDLVISADGKVVTTYDCKSYKRWVRIPLDIEARQLQLELKSAGANFTEIALYEYTPEELRARAERATALQRARAEQARRPVCELPPFGKVILVDEVDCAAEPPGHQFRESPAGASRVEPILGKPCRVLRPAENEASYMAFRIGRWKLLKPGAAYVLAVEYPEDAPRSVIVMNGGNETSRGFHTGSTVGDALQAKYVNSNPESLRVPLSGRYETWMLAFNLHDRFPDLSFLRGAKERKLTPEDGFDVVIAQFSKPNDPTSHGAAVSRIRLYEIADADALTQRLELPPAPLPRRRIFWREEMADGVIEGKNETERGVKNRLDWYRYKAKQMRWLGINTYTKDLLEFGACQHWDSTPGGGNDWVHFNYATRDLWAQIVALMGEQGFEVLPYYEYAGSKGYKGLGYQRRCKPLTRDDAYTHIKWVESANADITDPDTYADFKKMLDLTVLCLKDKARFAGIWIRPRWQLPMSFADKTLARFDPSVTRAKLLADPDLLKRYETWWFEKRREFLVAMRDHLRSGGIEDALVLYTAVGGEPGPSFPTWEKRIVTDDPAAWPPPLVPVSIERVVNENLYLDALLSPQLNWGKWEWHHANPPADPDRYRNTPGVLLTHAFNRLYTVASPKTFDAFRGPSGLAIVRHYALNENMMFDAADKDKLGYFIADIERAGPYCMLAEAHAMANGDPTMIGYLVGSNFGRGFPQYVREFNANFLALPALPSERLANASDDPEVVVRIIRTPSHGSWLAVINTGLTAKPCVRIQTPTGPMELSLHPCELRSLHFP